MKKMIFAALAFAVIACGQAKQEQTQTTTTESSTMATSATATTATTTTATTDTATTTETATTATAAATTSATHEVKKMSDSKDKVAELHTTAGEIDIRFFPDVAPNHVKNFIELAQQGFYNGTKFHRVIPGFMIQGGDPNTKKSDTSTWGRGGSGKNLKAEFNSIPHKRGIVSMARSADPNSASSQFFIVVKDSNFLDGQYTVFGQVTKGMDVADKIVNAPRGAQDVPNSPTTIESITIRDAKPDEKGSAPK